MSTEQRNGEQVKPDDVRELFRAERLAWRHGRRSTRISLSAIANFEELVGGWDGRDGLKAYEEASDVVLTQNVELAQGFTWALDDSLPSVAWALMASLLGHLTSARAARRESHGSSVASEEEHGE